MCGYRLHAAFASDRRRQPGNGLRAAEVDPRQRPPALLITLGADDEIAADRVGKPAGGLAGGVRAGPVTAPLSLPRQALVARLCEQAFDGVGV